MPRPKKVEAKTEPQTKRLNRDGLPAGEPVTREAYEKFQAEQRAKAKRK